jgi:steroid delta-isomerase-like uncharacterized protein
MPQDNRAVVGRINEEAFRQGHAEVADECMADDFVEHNPMPGFGADREGFKQMVASLHQAFPDFEIRVEDQVAEGDRVVERWTCTGTHEGEFMGIPATHNKVDIEGMDMSRLENGRIVEHWTQMDSLAMMQQLGVIPSEQEARA